MNWKSWPYWVKGGSAFLVVALLLRTFERACLFFIQGDAQISCIIFYVPLAPIGELFYSPDGILSKFAAWVIGYTIIGIIVGYLYGKFKNRKQLST